MNHSMDVQILELPGLAITWIIEIDKQYDKSSTEVMNYSQIGEKQSTY